MATIAIEPAVRDSHQVWIEEKLRYLGSSEAFELLEQPQYGKGCKTALAYRKLGLEPDYAEQVDDALLERGKILEPIVATLYGDVTDRKVRKPPMTADGHPKPKYHPRFSWAGVNTDRLILTGSGGVTETGSLEIKTRGEGPFLRVQRQGPFPGDILQGHWGLFVNNHNWGSVATLGVFGGLPLSYFDIKRDEEIIDIFVREGEAFAETVWGKGQVPAPTFPHTDQRCKVCTYRMTCRGEAIDKAEAAAIREITKSKKDLVQITNPELAHTLADIDLLKAEAKSVEETLDMAKTKAMELIGDVDAALVHGYGKAYRMESAAHYFDSTQFKADDPETYAKYYVSRKTGERYLRTYPTTKTA